MGSLSPQRPVDILTRLRESALFDEAWYARSADLGQLAAGELMDHYIANGRPSGRGPNEQLDRLLGAGPEPGHDAEVEAVACIRRSPMFNPAFYLAHNSDVARAGADPHLHFHRHGWKELRNPSAGFDTWWYCSAHLPKAS